MKNNLHLHPYQEVLTPFSSQELAVIVQLKRFFEWVQGDPDFMKSLEAGKITSEHRDRLKRIGVTFDLDDVAMLWESPDIFWTFWKKTQGYCPDGLPEDVVDTVKRYPLIELWIRFASHKEAIYRALRKQTSSVPKHSAFDAWRSRRIAAVRNELGFFGQHLDHPILAFELGDGCSVGCWFCAFAARKLTQNFDYSQNREFFRQIAQTCVDIFGRNQANMALLYYGTEPHDNPHYLDFVKDYTEIAGEPVCTSTAVTTDAKWIRELIAFYRQWTLPWPRLSVLSKSMLFKIHELYTPEELRDVELLMQMREHQRKKVTGGRILEEHHGLRDREAGHYLDAVVPQGSIACVTGFLINMVNKTIQLVSPCYTSQKWPYGYRIFDETLFDNGEGFRNAIEKLIARNMPETPLLNIPMRFRDDLRYQPTEDGFDLISPNQIHHLHGKEIYRPLGEMLAEGTRNYDELCDTMMGTYQINPMSVVAVIQKLFDHGFLDEVYVHE